VSSLPRRRRNRTLAMVAATVVVALSVPVLGYVGVKAVLDSTGGRDALEDNLDVQSFPNTPSALYLTTDQHGVLSSATVFVLAPSGVGGSIVSVPVNADVGLAANARRSLQQVFADGGVDAAMTAIESTLLVSITYSAVADPEQLVQFLTPYQPFTVQLTADVPGTDDGDATLPAGGAVLQAVNASRVLTAGLVDGQPVDPLRQGNIEAIWTSLVTSIGSGRAPATPIAGGPTTFDDLVVHLVAAQTQSRGLPARALTGAENPDDVDVVEVDRSEAVLVFASIAPGSMLAPAPGPVIRLEAPPGYDLQLKLTIDKLLFLTANVVSVNSTAEARPHTVFLVPDEANRLRVQTTDEIFGAITFGTPTARIESVDVTIQLGTDYLDGLTT
jgi:hypothetical protein